MKVDLKRMVDAIRSKSNNEEGPGKPKTKAEIEAYQKKLAEQGKGWDPKTNRVYDLVGGKSGKEMQYENRPDMKEKNPMGLKTFEQPTEERMAWGWDSKNRYGAVDRDVMGLNRVPTFQEKYGREATDEELFNEGLRRDSQSGDVFPMKEGESIKIDGVPYSWAKGRKITKPTVKK